MASPEGSPLGSPRGPHASTAWEGLLVKGALGSACTVGAWALYTLLETFETALKPLVLAALLVGCLEYFVDVVETTLIHVPRIALELVCCTCRCELCRQLGLCSRRRAGGPEAPAASPEALLESAPSRQGGGGGMASPRAGGVELAALWSTLPAAPGADDPHGQQRDVLLHRPAPLGCLGWLSSGVPPRLRARCADLVAFAGVGERFLYRLVAISLTLSAAGLSIALLWRKLFWAITHTDMHPYKDGVHELIGLTLKVAHRFNITNGSDVQDRLRTELTSEFDSVSDFVYNIVSSFISSSATVLVQVTFFLLYALFWLLRPMPSTKDVFKIVRMYFILKTASNVAFAMLVYALLHQLGVELAIIIAIACFVLAYIPEVGTIIAVALPVPAILLDSRRSLSDRGSHVLQAVLGMAAIKFVISNGLESVIMGRNKVLAGAVSEENNFVETHPVVVLFVVVLCGEIWGPIGMIIAVPIISLVRFYVARELGNHAPVPPRRASAAGAAAASIARAAADVLLPGGGGAGLAGRAASRDFEPL